MPFKANAARRHHIPKQRHRVGNWQQYDAALRGRGSLTVWFTEEAVDRWHAETPTAAGGQRTYSDLAITTALTLRAVYRLGPAPDRRVARLPRPAARDRPRCPRPVHHPSARQDGADPGHAGDGRWTGASAGGQLRTEAVRAWRRAGRKARPPPQRRRAWKKLPLGLQAGRGRIVAATLTDHDVDDASQVKPLLDQIAGPLCAVIVDGAVDQTGVYEAVAERPPNAAVSVPPRSTAVPSNTAKIPPTQRDRQFRELAEGGRMAWQKASQDNLRALLEALFSRYKRVIGDGLRFPTDDRQSTEGAIAVLVLNRRLDLGRPDSVRIA